MQIDAWPALSKVLFGLPIEDFVDIITGVGLEIEYQVSDEQRHVAVKREVYIARIRAAYSKLSLGNKEAIAYRIIKELRLRFPQHVPQLDANLLTIGLQFQARGFAEVHPNASPSFLAEQLKELAHIIATTRERDDVDTARERFIRWKTRTHALMKQELGEPEATNFDDLGNVSFTLTDPDSLAMEVDKYAGFLNALKEDLEAHPRLLRSSTDAAESLLAQESPLSRILLVLRRFHTIARQLRHRRESRHTIELNDEYDVQDLLHGLLKMFFDDVRPEEWTPSYAGKSSKVDFLLKIEGIVIEVKMTRKGLDAKEIGDQLIIDIERYRKMPECHRLICFVYDPDHRIPNPVGFENDLSRSEGNLVVQVMVLPKSF